MSCSLLFPPFTLGLFLLFLVTVSVLDVLLFHTVQMCSVMGEGLNFELTIWIRFCLDVITSSLGVTKCEQ